MIFWLGRHGVYSVLVFVRSIGTAGILLRLFREPRLNGAALVILNHQQVKNAS